MILVDARHTNVGGAEHTTLGWCWTLNSCIKIAISHILQKTLELQDRTQMNQPKLSKMKLELTPSMGPRKTYTLLAKNQCTIDDGWPAWQHRSIDRVMEYMLGHGFI